MGSNKFLQSWTGHLASAVNVLTKNPKISLNTRGDIFQINFPEKNEKTWSKRSHGAFASIWDAFTCWLSMRALKRRLLGSGLSKFFTACNFGNILAMTIIFCFKMFKIWCRFQKWKKKFRKGFLFFRYVPNIPNTCEISMKAVLSCFFIILREVDSENISPSNRWNLRSEC